MTSRARFSSFLALGSVVLVGCGAEDPPYSGLETNTAGTSAVAGTTADVGTTAGTTADIAGQAAVAGTATSEAAGTSSTAAGAGASAVDDTQGNGAGAGTAAVAMDVAGAPGVAGAAMVAGAANVAGAMNEVAGMAMMPMAGNGAMAGAAGESAVDMMPMAGAGGMTAMEEAGAAGMSAMDMPDDGSPSEPAPSPGCSGGNANATIANSIIDKPNGYDGSTPLPLVIALHANNNPNTQLQGYFGAEGKARGYLLVYPGAASGSWNFQSDRGRIDAAYDGMINNYCVDMNRVYGIGHSGGAQTLTQLLCDGDDRFRAVSPIASSKYCNGWDPIPALVIHGVNDEERGSKYGINDADGKIDFGVYRDSNQCSQESTPFTPGGSCGANINPGCSEFEGCAARTQFCNHNDPEYSNTNHGVPCFAKNAVFDFFDAEN